MMRLLQLGLAAFAITAQAAASPLVPYLPVQHGDAVVLDTGSTNTAGYRIVVRESGAAEYIVTTDPPRRSTASLAPDIAKKFFTDLRAAMPLSQLHIAPCMKSISFGTSRFVWWRGQRSPDVTCPGAPALDDDIAKIATALLGSQSIARRGHIVPPLPNEPRRPFPSASPVSP